MKKKFKIIISITVFISVLTILFIVLLFTGVIRFGKFHKENCIQSFLTPKNQIVFTVGTIHNQMLDPEWDYSLKDVKSLILYVKPDYVYIESRPETYEKYGVIDGPIEMIYIYSYCQENGIPVRMIDWWQENNQSKANTTSIERDDHIFANICSNLEDVSADQKVMIFYGTKHFHDQMPRMKKAGWQLCTYGNPAGYFYYSKKEFSYPKDFNAEIQKKIDFLDTAERACIDKNITDINVHDEFTENLEGLIQTLKNTLQLVSQNRLYFN